jgi:hypothetical protein
MGCNEHLTEKSGKMRMDLKAQPTYGIVFLQCLASIYPGYHATRTMGDILMGTGYAFVDGAIGGWLFGWLYNRAVRHRQS